MNSRIATAARTRSSSSPDPAKKAQREAENGVRQFQAALDIIRRPGRRFPADPRGHRRTSSRGVAGYPSSGLDLPERAGHDREELSRPAEALGRRRSRRRPVRRRELAAARQGRHRTGGLHPVTHELDPSHRRRQWEDSLRGLLRRAERRAGQSPAGHTDHPRAVVSQFRFRPSATGRCRPISDLQQVC